MTIGLVVVAILVGITRPLFNVGFRLADAGEESGGVSCVAPAPLGVDRRDDGGGGNLVDQVERLDDGGVGLGKGHEDGVGKI